jgi:ABC-type branched-subunit amino acid transport system substrate-binding protein
VGAETVNTAYLDIAGGAGKLAAEFVDLGLTPRGVPKASITAIPTGGGDLQPSVQQTIDEDTEGVAVVAVDPEFSKWLVAYRQTGGEAQLVATGSTLNPSNVKALGDAVEGVYVATNFKPASLTKDPGVKQMIKEVKAFDKGIRLFDGSIEAWAGVHLVADALDGQAANDAATLLAQLNSDTTWDTRVGPSVNFTVQPPEIAETGGLIASIPRVFTTSVYYAQVKNGKLKAVDNKAHNFLVG